MKKNFKATGIIIRKIDFGEADRIITLLTKKEGKIDLLAKGGRKAKHKFCGRLELFNEVEIEGFSGKSDLDYLKEIRIAHTLPEIKTFDQHKLLFYLAEITHRFIQPHQHIDGVYELLREALVHISYQKPLSVVLHTYLTKLLTKIGFLPIWNECSECNEKIDLNQKTYVRSDDAHLKCSYCANNTDEIIDRKMVKWIHFIQNYDFKEVFKVKLTEQESKQTWNQLQKVIQPLISRPIKSEVFL